MQREEEYNDNLIDINMDFDIFNNTYKNQVSDLKINDHITDYSWFKKAFFEENPYATEEDLWNILKKKKGIFYIDFSNAENFTLPNKECCGGILPINRRIAGQKILGDFYAIKENGKLKKYRYYENLQNSTIGLIPIESEKYIFMCKRKTTIFSIIFLIVFIRLFLLTYFKI